MKKKFYVDFDKDVFDSLKRRAELMSRHIDGNDDLHVITDTDKKTLSEFFTEFISEFRNETGLYDRLKDYDGLIMYVVDEDVEQGIEKLKPTLVQAIIEYLLMRWFDAVGLLQLSMNRRAIYMKILRDWRNNSTKTAFVTPKYRPYF